MTSPTENASVWVPKESRPPPAATTGTLTASTTRGTSAMVPVRSAPLRGRNQPLWPPASAP